MEEQNLSDQKTGVGAGTSGVSGVLIDDDFLITMGWSMVAKQHGRELVTFSDPSEFKQNLDRFDRSVPIFIDSNLAGGVKGEIVAKDFFDAGFKSIYLVTGYSPSQFGFLPWIKGILDKSPPGWLFGQEGD